jgi:heme-degrading monooxygenase HmoA
VLLQREQGTEVEFLVLTRWESLAAIAAFAGNDVARAVVEPEAMAALTAFDRRAQHYEVVEEQAFG